MRFISSRLAPLALVLAGACTLAACTTTGSSAMAPGSQAGDASGVTVFGTMDVGVGGVR